MGFKTERVNAIIQEHLGCDPDAIDDKDPKEVRLVEDLGADSLDAVEITIALETEFNMEISDAEVEKWRTLDDVHQTVLSRLQFVKENDSANEEE